jgi:hypothetical protein
VRAQIKARLIVETFVIFMLLLPAFSILLRFVQTGYGDGVMGWAANVIGYCLVFPGWFLALCVFGYSSGPTTASTIFIIVTNALFYSSLAALVLFILASLRDANKSASPPR